MKSVCGRFEIGSHTKDDTSYFYSDSSTTWWVKSVEFGDELASFSGRDSEDANGSRSSGTDTVCFTEEGDAVLATGYDGEVERVELPKKLALADGGRTLVLTYADGRVERRERHAVFYTLKFGTVVGEPLHGLRPEKKSTGKKAGGKKAAGEGPTAGEGAGKPTTRKKAGKTTRKKRT